MRHWVYVHIAADGTALYVGVTARYLARQSEHRRRSPWFAEMAETAKLGPFDDKSYALAFERELISELQPPNNLLRTEREHDYYSAAFAITRAKHARLRREAVSA